MEAATLAAPGYSVREFEQAVGLSPKIGYYLIKEGKVKAYKNSAGELRIHPMEVYLYQREMDN